MTGIRGAASPTRRRPRDWHPLAGTDPVPGDPDAILDEVAHMRQVAAMLRGEAKDLKVIGEGEGLKGHYADALRDGARGLEKRLRETAERYERVHGHLAGWAHELEEFQADADRILRRARADAEAVAMAAAGASGQSADSGSGSTDGEDATGRHRKALAAVEAHRDERAAHYAARIRHELDDIIKDSRWERCKDVLDDFQGAISFVLDVMSWVATGIAVAAICSTPAGWATALAIWLAVGVFAGHLVLAAAGIASWADVAMDVFGLLAMGVGTVALRGLRDIRNATKLAAEVAAEERAAAEAARANRSVRDSTSAVVNRRGSTRAARARARHTRNIARAADRRAGRAAAAAEAATPIPDASRWESVSMGGERESANMAKDVRRLRAAYPESEAVQKASEGMEEHKWVFQGTWTASTALDAWDKITGSSDIFPGKWQYGTYNRFKDLYTKEIGTAW